MKLTVKEVRQNVEAIMRKHEFPLESKLPYDSGDARKKIGWQVSENGLVTRWGTRAGSEPPHREYFLEVTTIEDSRKPKMPALVDITYSEIEIEHRWQFALLMSAPPSFSYFLTYHDLRGENIVGSGTHEWAIGLDWVDQLVQAIMNHKP